MRMNLHEYVSAQPRGVINALANAVGAHAPDVSRWVTGKRPIPVQHAASIEKFTGGVVTRKDMFPDTWHKVWPELAQQAAKPTGFSN